ncbi:MAG: xanthine dehydrogenase accessory protein XdhC, partial [Octadecabacter sp.]|nr:xanthine dehydrogenase accessory protein XdhC [Octadecabacter sp.]
GTIGGGALEWDAARIARDMLANGAERMERTIPLGPDLGQCCGGVVTLAFERDTVAQNATQNPAQKPQQPSLWIWGAGHVGRAIASVMAPFDDREVVLVDVAADRFPEGLAKNVLPLVAGDPARLVTRAPAKADHLILTYSHDLDLALCDALLRHGFNRAGLIGSATKWARFRSRLGKMGHADAEISRIACPIGNVALGKHPQAIAVGVTAALVSGPDHALGGRT